MGYPAIRSTQTAAGLERPRPFSQLYRQGRLPRQCLRRGVNSSQVADPWISPLTNLHPPNASGGNMYLQRSQRTSGVGAGL